MDSIGKGALSLFLQLLNRKVLPGMLLLLTLPYAGPWQPGTTHRESRHSLEGDRLLHDVGAPGKPRLLKLTVAHHKGATRNIAGHFPGELGSAERSREGGGGHLVRNHGSLALLNHLILGHSWHGGYNSRLLSLRLGYYHPHDL